MQCDNCIHKPVCAYNQSRLEISEKINSIEVGIVFRIDVTCKYFEEVKPMPKSYADMQTYPGVGGCVVVDNLGRVHG